MLKLLHQLKAAAYPFVHRVFRGPRLRRYTVISAALGCISLLIGMWLAFGTGEIERETRIELGLETPTWEVEERTYTRIYHDVEVYELALEDRQQLLQTDARGSTDYGTLESTVEAGRRLLEAASYSTAPERYQDLQRDAVALSRMHPPQSDWRDGFPAMHWRHDHQVERLQAIVDARLVPNVVLYSSPLSFADAFTLIGLVAGGMGLVILLVAAPLFAGAQIAQEANENTLQPLLGTKLNARALVLGLTAGPVAAAGLFAAPQLALFALSVVIAGKVVVAPGFIILTLASAFLLTMLTQLLGFGMGKRWASGLVGTILTALLVLSMIAAIAVGCTIENETAGLVAILPQAGSIHLLVEAFVPQSNIGYLDATVLDIRLCFAAVAFVILGLTTVRALERRITGRTQTALTRGESLVAAVTLVLLAVSAMPEFDPGDAVPVYFLSLALVLIPFQVLLMGRVPTGDGPAKLRKVPLSRLLLEFALWTAIHAAVVFVALGGNFAFSIAGAFYLVWALTVAAFIAVRFAAIPMRLLSGVYACFALFAAMLSFGLAAALFEDSFHASSDAFFVLFEASPLLGIVQIALMVAIPWTFVRSLSKGSAGLH